MIKLGVNWKLATANSSLEFNRITVMPSLTLIKSPGGQSGRQTFTLDGNTLVLGRDESCDVVIPNNAVSRRHAQILCVDGKYILEDLNSRNKTFLNNREITTAPLKNDDKIKICDFLFLFTDDKPVASAPKPLPREFEPENGEEQEADVPSTETTTVQSTVPRSAAQQLLDVQPTDKLRALLDISTTLSKTLELEPLLPQIAETLFSVFRQADRCLIIMLEEGDKLVPKLVKSRRPGRADEGFSRTIVRQCMQSMKAYLTEDASAESALATAQSIASLQIRSVMCVPLATAEGKPLGVIQLDTMDYIKKFKEDDLKLLTIVANVASVSVEKASVHAALLARQKQEQEIELAKKVQLGFLPQTCPEFPNYEFYSFYSAAQSVGGDYYDFIELPGGKIATVLGDVAGKGVPASLLMAKLSAEARYCMLTQPNPATAVSRLNDQLIRGGIGDRFVTLAALVLDPNSHEVTIVNAGHINPLRFSSATGEIQEAITDAQSGLPLGLVPGYDYEAVSTRLSPGESLMIFTDGVTDAMNPQGDMFGLEGVKMALEADDTVLAEFRPKRLGAQIIQSVRNHAQGRAQNDDIAFICFGRIDSSGPITKSQTSRMPAIVIDNESAASENS